MREGCRVCCAINLASHRESIAPGQGWGEYAGSGTCRRSPEQSSTPGPTGSLLAAGREGAKPGGRVLVH